jgi:predicted ATP-dependent serine protease
MERIFASDRVKNCPAHKGGFSYWLELEGNTIETFISLAEADLANKKPPEQAYLEKFGIKPASALFDMHFELLRFLYDGLIPAVGLTLLAALPKVGKSWFVLNLAKHIDADGIPVHYLAAEDNERRLKDRVQAVFRGHVQHLTYHAVMSTEEKLPRGAAALSHIELIAKGTKAQCIVIDTVQSILIPSANNKN